MNGARRFSFGLIGLAMSFAIGCGGRSADDAATAVPASDAQFRAPLLRNAIYVLNNLEQFDVEPALDQVTERLNQWARSQDVPIAWKPDPLIDTLPKNLRSGDWFEKLGDKSYDHDADGNFLKEATWLRDISNSARGDKLEELEIAERLFDWTIRNIQLIDEPTKATATQVKFLMRRFPADILLLGEGTPLQRAWVFMLLARQQRLDVVMLATADPEYPDRPRAWLPALLHKDQLYLFDTRLGLPLPGPGGNGIATLAEAIEDESVLAQLHLDEQNHYPILSGDLKSVYAFVEGSPGYLSRRMKVLESQLAGVERVVLSAEPSEIAARLKKVTHLTGEPKLWPIPFDTLALRLSEQEHGDQRFKQAVAIEQAPFKIPAYFGPKFVDQEFGARQRALDDLVGVGETRSGQSSFGENVRRRLSEQSMSEGELAAKLGMKAEDISAIENSGQAPSNVTVRQFADALGLKPTELLARDNEIKRPTRVTFPLWAGRLLHFRNVYGGERGAKHYYIASRPGDDELPLVVGELAMNFQRANNQPPSQSLMQSYSFAVMRRKQDATYWLGLVSFDEGEFATAEDYFRKLTLDVWPGGPWTGGATYNLGRTYEANGKRDEALKLYEADQSPQRFGNRLRARQLKQREQPAEKSQVRPAA